MLAFAFHHILVVPRGNRFDFYAAWAALQAVKADEDPYSTLVSQRIQEQQNLFSDCPDNGGFVHPPHVLVLFYPASYLPFSVFVSLWVAALFIVCLISVVLGLRLLRIRPSAAETAALAFACLMFRYSMMSITFAQPTCLCLCALLVALWLLSNHRDWWVGFALAVALIKPDLTIGLVLILLGVALLNGRPRVLWGLVSAALLLAAAVTLLLGWTWPIDYLRAVMSYMDYHTSTWAITALPLPIVLVLIPLVALAVGQMYRKFREKHWGWFAAYAVGMSFILVPQSGTYNLTLLLVPVVIGWAYTRGVVRWGWLALWWFTPWLVWARATSPSLDLRIMPWMMVLGILVLDLVQGRSIRQRAIEVKQGEKTKGLL